MKYISLLGLIVLSTCTQAHYKNRPFTWPTGSHSQTQNNVTICVTPLPAEETKELFNGAGKKLVRAKNSVIPLCLTIDNKSDQTLTLDYQDIDLKMVNVASRLKNIQRNRKIAYIAAGASLAGVVTYYAIATAFVSLWAGTLCPAYGTTLLAPGYSMLMWPEGLLVTAVLVGSAGLGATAGYLYQRSLDPLPDRLVYTLSETIPETKITINPGECTELIIFAPWKTFKNDFTITLAHGGTEKIEYAVILH